MANFKSVLSDIGKGLAKFFSVAVGVAVVAEFPIIDVVFPGLAPLYNTTVNAVADAEAKAIAAGQQNGTGAQKLALVVASIEADFNAYAKANNLPTPNTAIIENYVNAVVATINSIPAANA